MDGGIFSSKYVLYMIKTASKGWLAERRYDSFLELREYFVKQYPGSIIPPLPKLEDKSLAPPIVENNKGYLQRFMNDVLDHPIIRSSNLFMLFISVSSEKDFDSKKKEYLKITPPKKVEDCRSINGIARVEMNLDLLGYGNSLSAGVENLKEYFKEYEIFVYSYRLKGLQDMLVSDLGKVAETSTKIMETYNVLGQIYSRIGENDLMDVFTTLGGTFERLQKSYKQQGKLYSENFSKFFQYYAYELAAVEEAVSGCGLANEKLNQAEKKLRDKKDALFLGKQVAKWEIDRNCKVSIDTLLNNKDEAFKEMLPNETKETAKFRILNGYYCNLLIEEFTRLSKKDEKLIKDNCLDVARKYCDLLTDVLRH